MFGALLGAAGSLVSGLMGRSATQDANAANIAQAQANNATQERIAAQNIANQREFAQQGIRWKVDDARAAGLHPLAALGAQVSSFSPISVGSSSADIKAAPSLDMGAMGQSIGSAIDKTRTGEEKIDAYTQKLQALQLERGSLENTLLKGQILKTGQSMQPAFPSIGDTPPTFPNGVPLPRSGPDRTFGGHAITDDKIEQKPESDFPVKKLRMYGAPVEMPSWLSSGQDWEDALGEVGGSAMGIANIPGIVVHNILKHYYPEFQKRMGSGNPFDRLQRRNFNQRFHY